MPLSVPDTLPGLRRFVLPRQGREIALQMLYQAEAASSHPSEVLRSTQTAKQQEPDKERCDEQRKASPGLFLFCGRFVSRLFPNRVTEELSELAAGVAIVEIGAQPSCE